MAGKCEHGLTTAECFVCASPKYGLYPLPKSEATSWHPFKYTEHQMRAYAAEQVAAERERCAKLCDDIHRENHFMPPGYCAERIREMPCPK